MSLENALKRSAATAGDLERMLDALKPVMDRLEEVRDLLSPAEIAEPNLAGLLEAVLALQAETRTMAPTLHGFLQAGAQASAADAFEGGGSPWRFRDWPVDERWDIPTALRKAGLDDVVLNDTMLATHLMDLSEDVSRILGAMHELSTMRPSPRDVLEGLHYLFHELLLERTTGTSLHDVTQHGQTMPGLLTALQRGMQAL